MPLHRDTHLVLDQLHPGDRVVFREWEDMKSEYCPGVWNSNSEIRIEEDGIWFASPMKVLCGTEHVVKQVYTVMGHPRVKFEDEIGWSVSPGMLRMPGTDYDDVDVESFLSVIGNV